MKTFVIRNARSVELASLTVDVEGKLQLMVDDDFYSGELSREQSEELAWTILETLAHAPVRKVPTDTINTVQGGGSSTP